MALVYLVQHAHKQPEPGDPGLTDTGERQAARTGQWLGRLGLRAVYSSPMRRAWQTAEPIAALHGLTVRPDERLRERMNWDGTQPLEEFMADWTRCVHDRDFVPRAGDSSRQAGSRMAEFLREVADQPGPVAAVSHGGVTVDLLRTLLGDQALPASLLYEGVPSCAITTFKALTVVEIAHTDHLL
ncbi:histidine phosphatase family protein [Hamadaea tsunoensis]|uniref:histidine phosphatase family protein n=1 Tax=Hamadaea tsunoensis TaxID=53368 RepID=UPI000428FAB1|nr:histidine phosphatase family protein [Hamadaea tsunoensis]